MAKYIDDYYESDCLICETICLRSMMQYLSGYMIDFVDTVKII